MKTEFKPDVVLLYDAYLYVWPSLMLCGAQSFLLPLLCSTVCIFIDLSIPPHKMRIRSPFFSILIVMTLSMLSIAASDIGSEGCSALCLTSKNILNRFTISRHAANTDNVVIPSTQFCGDCIGPQQALSHGDRAELIMIVFLVVTYIGLAIFLVNARRHWHCRWLQEEDLESKVIPQTSKSRSIYGTLDKTEASCYLVACRSTFDRTTKDESDRLEESSRIAKHVVDWAEIDENVEAIYLENIRSRAG